MSENPAMRVIRICGPLAEALDGADVFLGLSAPGVLKAEMVARMGNRPIVFALANPTPEILPEEVKKVRPEAIVATGRSDYPNQVNNVLCFPFIFRGALDVGAIAINEPMKIACVKAIARLARAEASEIVATAYQGDKDLQFGPNYIIPKPFDPRLIIEIAPAVAKAAMESGVATRPIEDFNAYRDQLTRFVFRSGLLMKPVFDRARRDPRRIVFAEGEEERILRAVQTIIDEGLAKPIIIGRATVLKRRIHVLGLRLKLGENVEHVDPERDPRFNEYWSLYHRLTERKGVTPIDAQTLVRTRNTIIAALMVKKGEAEAMLCGTIGSFGDHLKDIDEIIGKSKGNSIYSTLSSLILPSGNIFITDTDVNPDPDAGQIAEITRAAADILIRFGIKPKAALLSHSNFGSAQTLSARKMRAALRLLHDSDSTLEVEGEMRGDSAISEIVRERLFPNSRLTGKANLLVMPNLDAANIALNLLRYLGDGLMIGPILMGAAQPAHILTPATSVRGIINMSALAVTEAQDQNKMR